MYFSSFSLAIDIDECTDGSHTCSPNANCTNLPGKFKCRCNVGYMGDGKTCKGKYKQAIWFLQFVDISAIYENTIDNKDKEDHLFVILYLMLTLSSHIVVFK